jgi:cytoskeletal protein CcmA (bactofilin family)
MGALEGDVTVGNLVVGETGAIKGRITVAENAEISGKVFEKLDVKCLLILRSTGRVDGNISYGLLQIEQGASIAGGLSSTDYRPEQQKTPKLDLYPRDREQKSPKQEGTRRKTGRLVVCRAVGDAHYTGRPVIWFFHDIGRRRFQAAAVAVP